MKVRQELTAREVDELHASLMRRIGDTTIPTLPQVAVKIIELMGNQNATLQQFADVIKTDQALTGRLLRLANSAMFAQRQPVTQLHRAMVLMGMEKLKAIALGFHLSKAMAADDGPFSLRRVWTQSLFRAWLALHIVETIDKKISGEAFIVGLLSDAGMSAMAKLAGPEFVAAINGADTPSRQFLDELRKLPFTHVDASAVLCRVWKLPAMLARPISMHHTPARSVAASDPASVLHATAYYVGSLSLDAEGNHPSVAQLPELADRYFGIDPDGMVDLIRKASDAFKATRELFAHMIDPHLSVESIVEQANGQVSPISDDDSLPVEPEDEGERFHAEGLVYEFHRGPDRCVTAYISDEEGNRLVAEQIDPRAHNEKRIRELLLLETADPAEVRRIMNGIRALAA